MRYLVLLFSLCGALCASTVSAQTITKLIVASPVGEPIGGGSNYTLTPNDGFTFNGAMNPLGGPTITIHNADYSRWWQIDFAGANDEPLMPGRTYTNCVRYPQSFDNTNNQMQASSSNAPPCTSLTGTFMVKQMTWSPPFTVGSFWVILDQQCVGDTPPLHLELMYNIPLATPTSTSSWGRVKTFYR